MTKCSVDSVRNFSAGSNTLAAPTADDNASRTAHATSGQVFRLETGTPSVPGRFAGDVLQEREVGNRQDVNTAEVAPGDRRVRLAPKAGVRGFFGRDSVPV